MKKPKTTDYPYKILEDKYQRFDEKNNMIYRRLWDETLSTYRQMFSQNIPNHIKSGKEGYSRFDFAFVKAGWAVYENFPLAFAWEKKETIDPDYGTDWTKEKYYINDIHAFTWKIKKVAKAYGSSLVGIADVNKNWIYRTGFVRPKFASEEDSKRELRKGNINGSPFDTPINIPKDFSKVIVMAIEMESDAISTAPAQPAAAAASIVYSKMAFSIACMGEFIRNLGYRALQCGNDTALSIPLAVDAGLGGLGRIGLLVTPEFGPRVRICKVFTDLPLIADKPNYKFIQKLNNVCKTCFKCADACHNDAITRSECPQISSSSISNNSGVEKYYVDVEKCFEFWVENSSDCGACIAACPFSKIKEEYTPKRYWSEN